MQRIKDIASKWYHCASKILPLLIGGRPNLYQGEWSSIQRRGQSTDAPSGLGSKPAGRFRANLVSSTEMVLN